MTSTHDKSLSRDISSGPRRGRRFHYGYVIVICCCLMMGINVGVSFSCAGIFYRPVSESLGVPVGEFGIYMSIMYITSTISLPFAGRLLERYSSRWLFAGNAAVMGLVFISMGLYDRVWEFYIAGGLLGITLAFLLYLSFPTLVNRWFRSRIGLMIGICSAASGIGGMLLNPLAGWMITAWGWRWAYATFGGIILLVITPLLACLLRDYPADIGIEPYSSAKDISDDKQTATDGMTYQQALRSPMFYGIILFAFIMMGTSTLNLFIPGYVSDNGFSIEQASLAASAVMAGVTVGKLALGWINDRSCITGTALTTTAGIGGLLILLAGAESIVLIISGGFLFGWAYAGVTVQTAMLTRNVFGASDYGRIYSVVSIALSAGGAIASGGWGLLADSTSDRFIFICGIVCLAICLLTGILVLRNKKSQSSNGSATKLKSFLPGSASDPKNRKKARR